MVFGTMGHQKPCHMPCCIPTKTTLYSFKPVTVEVARAKIEELGLAIPVEPFQHPDLRVCYATDAHVLTHAPASLPENVVEPVVMCQSAYMRYTTHNVLHNRKHKGAQQSEQLMAEREAEAARDEVGLFTLRMFYAAQYSGYLLGLAYDPIQATLLHTYASVMVAGQYAISKAGSVIMI